MIINQPTKITFSERGEVNLLTYRELEDIFYFDILFRTNYTCEEKL